MGARGGRLASTQARISGLILIVAKTQISILCLQK